MRRSLARPSAGLGAGCLLQAAGCRPPSSDVCCCRRHASALLCCRLPSGFQPLIDAANGQPTRLDCDPATAMCMVAIRDFLIPEIPAACTAAECLVDSYSLEEGKRCLALARLLLVLAVCCGGSRGRVLCLPALTVDGLASIAAPSHAARRPPPP